MQKRTKDYDNVFKTLKSKHSKLFIPVINEIFGKNYALDTPVEVLPSEGFLEGKELADGNLILADFSKEEMISKKLYSLIPFYMARYEKTLTGNGNSMTGHSRSEPTMIDCAAEDLEYLRDELVKAHERQDLSDMEFLDLTKFVNTIITHMTNGNEWEERLVKIMGGVVLETESEKLVRIGMEQGRKEGIKEGMKEGERNILISLVKDKLLGCREAARRIGMTEEQFQRIIT